MTSEAELVAYYGRKSRQIDELRATYEHPNWYRRAFYRARFTAVFEALDPKPGERILDLGSGPGYYARHINARGGRVVALDIAKGYLEQASSHTRARVLGHARRIPFRAHTFDKVLATEVLEHTLFPQEVLAELARVLKPQGRAIVTSPSRTSYMDRLYELKSKLLRYSFREHVQEFDRDEFKTLLQRNFAILEIRYANCLIPYPLDILAMKVPRSVAEPVFQTLEHDLAHGRGGPLLAWTMIATVVPS